MPDCENLFGFGLVALGMALTPGPNMIYLLSRTICHGRRAGFISLGGIALGFVFYMLCAAFGITAFVFAVPHAYEILRYGGAVYLFYLAWQSIKPGAQSVFTVNDLPEDSNRKLLAMGFFTNLTNPKIAIMYVSLLPQFIKVGHGSVPIQSLALGSVQISVSMVVNGLLAVMAGYIAPILVGRPAWLNVQRWTMGGVLAGMAVGLLYELRQSMVAYLY